MQSILIYVLVILLGLFAVGAFFENVKMQALIKEAEKKLNEEKEIEKKIVSKVEEANQVKSDARTGNHERDLNFMADKLHELSKK